MPNTKVRVPPERLGRGMTTYIEIGDGKFKADEVIVSDGTYHPDCKGYHYRAQTAGKGTKTICYTHSTRVWVDG